jgi:hypothetical protein
MILRRDHCVGAHATVAWSHAVRARFQRAVVQRAQSAAPFERTMPPLSTYRPSSISAATFRADARRTRTAQRL